jgi:hypothetical protein
MAIIKKVGDTYAAMLAHFHGGQTPGQFYRDPPKVVSSGTTMLGNSSTAPYRRHGTDSRIV